MLKWIHHKVTSAWEFLARFSIAQLWGLWLLALALLIWIVLKD